MILQIFADAGQLMRYRDAVLLQHSAGPMPESCNSCGELHRARGEQDHCRRIAPPTSRSPCRNSTPVTRLPSRRRRLALRAGQHCQIGARRSAGRRKRLGGVPAHAALLVDLEIAAALVVAAVEIVDLGNADLGGRIAKGVEDLPGEPLLLDPPFAAGAVHLRPRRAP